MSVLESIFNWLSTCLYFLLNITIIENITVGSIVLTFIIVYALFNLLMKVIKGRY